MTASEHLSQFGLTVPQVRDYILDNLDNPEAIFSAARTYEITNTMLAEVVGGVTAQDVREFFSSQGLEGSVLDSFGQQITTALDSFLDAYGLTLGQARQFIQDSLSDPQGLYQVIQQVGVSYDLIAEIYGGITAGQVESFFSRFEGNGGDGGATGGDIQLVTDNVSGLLSIVGPNDATGNLSTENLRAQVIAVTGAEAYNQAFDVSAYEGAGDGVFTPTDLGFSDLGELPATQETLESLFYGSIINSLRAIDMQEVQELQSFVTQNQGQLAFGGGDAFNSYMDLIVGIYEDPAANPILPDSAIETIAVTTGQFYVGLVGNGNDVSVLEGMFATYL